MIFESVGDGRQARGVGVEGGGEGFAALVQAGGFAEGGHGQIGGFERQGEGGRIGVGVGAGEERPAGGDICQGGETQVGEAICFEGGVA